MTELILSCNSIKNRTGAQAIEQMESSENNDRNDAAVAATVADAPSIFKLDVECFHKLFYYLSLKELIAVGKTCKHLQKCAGEFFQTNYKQKLVNFGEQKALKIFKEFIPKINIRFNDKDQFPFIGSNCNAAKGLQITHLTLTSEKIDHLQKIMDKIEHIQMDDVQVEFRNNFLDRLTKLNEFSIRTWEDNIANIDNIVCWLQNYPKLEHFELNLNRAIIINDIGRFFERNSNILSFATTSEFFWANREMFAILGRIDKNMFLLLTKLYNKNFYKRLYMYLTDDSDMSHISKVNGLKKLYIIELNTDNLQGFHIDLAGLEELAFEMTSLPNTEKLAKDLVNVERIHIYQGGYDHIIPFI